MVKGEDGEASFLFGLVEDVTDPDMASHVSPITVMNDAYGCTIDFRFSFAPEDAIVNPFIQERVDINIRHAEFIGITSIRQFISIEVANVISLANGEREVLQNDYLIDQLAGSPMEYNAMVRRMDLVQEGPSRYEPMTTYDSDVLREMLEQLREAVYLRQGGIVR